MRKRQAKKRPLLPDAKYNDQLVTRFVNNLMWDGKKSVAFKIFYDAIDIVEQNGFGSVERCPLQCNASCGSTFSPCRGSYFPNPYANTPRPQSVYGYEVAYWLCSQAQ